jgi:choline dehydrogenase
MSHSPSDGVVDTSFRVHSVGNLRVIDASVFPFLPPGSPTALIYALAEKGADAIKVSEVNKVDEGND